ncbi:CbtA family protein [Mycolicibacterium vanbaalenii]|uniref:CbtA family protein n=1 Tax=Mycolicibacterium vanbaalenii TaxID=110539 RepID=UPI00006E4639
MPKPKGTNEMEKQIIWRGLLAGTAAGVLAFGFARIFAAPQTARAIEYEDGVRAAREAMDSPGGHAGHGENVDLFTRTVQMNIGMGLGLLAEVPQFQWTPEIAGRCPAGRMSICRGRVGHSQRSSRWRLLVG